MFNTFFIRYFPYLHFNYYPLSQFPLQKSPILSPLPLLPNPPTPASWPWHSPGLGHRIFPRPRVSPPNDGRLDHLLLHMQLETMLWCVAGYWLVHIVVPPIGLQTPSAPWILSLAPPLGALCSIQQMTVSIHFCVCQALAQPHMIQLYQGHVSNILAYSTVSAFGG